MRISEQTHYICIESHVESEDIDFSLVITKKLPPVLKRWGATTRISPIWPLYIKASRSFQPPEGRIITDVFFLSCIDPTLLYEHLKRETIEELQNGQLWLTIGMHNVIILSHDEDISNEVESFCLATSAEAERWIVSDVDERGHLVDNIQYFRPSDYSETAKRTPSTKTAKQAFSLPEWPVDDPLSFTILELYALISVIEGRSVANFPLLSDDALSVEKEVSRMIARPGVSQLEKRDTLIALNAGLSRLSSQALSGTSPISRTECHFWPHSLLGIGIANYALRNVTDFVISCVRKTKYHEKYRLAQGLEFDKTLIPEQSRDSSEAYFKLDRQVIAGATTLQSLSVDDAAQEPVVNPITYYSGRDGFRNGAFTTSAPLMSVAGANSVQWNLGTITHELSHRILSGKLEDLFEAACDEIQEKSQTMADYFAHSPSTIGEFGQRLLTMSLVVLNAQRYPDTADLDEALSDPLQFLNEAKAVYSVELEEILVHIFDYHHFYGLNKKTYVDFIWQSWAVQPSISQKLDHYIKRTVTALSVEHYRLKDWKERAIKDFEALLDSEPLKSKLPFYAQAKALLSNEEARNDIANYLTQMTHAITLFHFLFKSDELRLTAMDDPFRNPTDASATGSDGKQYRTKRNYSATMLMLASDSASFIRPEFANPLLFLRDFSTDPEPSAARSAWLLHMLSFNTKM